MSVMEIFQTMTYGPAPESATPAQAWLDAHDGNSTCSSITMGGAGHR